MKFKKLMYYWNKFIKKLPGSAIHSSIIPSTSKIEARSTIIDTEIGVYSYAGYNCTILNTMIGNFCSIADNVTIGITNHPLNWVSTSPAFYYGKDSIPKDMACKEYNPPINKTVIGSDVWIGRSVIVKGGISIGTGAVVGMGSIVTKDVPPYSIAVGVPARVIGYRFDENTRKRLLDTKWWDKSKDEICHLAHYMDDVEKFLNVIENEK